MLDGTAQSRALPPARRGVPGPYFRIGASLSGKRPTRRASGSAKNTGRRDRAIFIAFVAMTISVTFLQCFGVPLGNDAAVPVAVPVMALSLAALCYFVPPRIDPRRVGLYLAFVIAATVATGFFADRYSPVSLALLVLLYAPFALSFPTSEANFHRCLKFFSNVMVGLAMVEFAQHAIQIVAGPLAWPDLYQLMPKSVLIPYFNYLQPLVWHSHFDKPQAFVFLETSFLSQYLALALAIEIVMFQRPKRIALFAAALFATFAGTGILLMAVALPVLVGRMSFRNKVLIVAILLVVTGLADQAGWLNTVGGRVNEYQKTGGSANHRFIEPFDRMVAFLGKPGAIYSGIGAGQIEKTDNHQFWPIAKATIEYGLITGAAFYAFLVYALFDRPPSRRLAFALLLWFTFEGSLLTAVNPITCVMLSSLFVIERERSPGRRRRRSQPAIPGAAPRPNAT